jgi:circadian clock protein KaiC
MSPEPEPRHVGVEVIAPAQRAAERFATGVPNLDLVLGGGLLRGTIVMVVGPPGSGKTILGQQIAFCAAGRGEVALYFTGYSETHDKLLAHNRSLEYFVPEAIGAQVQMGSLPDLMAEGPEEAKQAVIATARKQHASLVILDGFRSIRGFLPDEQAAAEFLYSLGARLALLGATLLVLVEGDATDRIRDPEQSVCDVILSLHRVVRGGGHRREIEVLKVRGAAPLAGLHPITIDARGLTVYPRLESVVPADSGQWSPARAAFGIQQLDTLIEGGLNVGTTTLAAGTPGLGKTLLGLHFLAEGARRGQRGLYAGFTESTAQLRAKAQHFGLDLEAAEREGALELLMVPPHDLDADLVAWQIRERIEARHAERLVIDSDA